MPTNSKKQSNVYWKNRFYQVIYSGASSPVPEILFIAALVLSRKQRLYFNYTSQIWWPLLLLGIIALLGYYGYRVIFGKGSTAHLAALLFCYGIYGYYATGNGIAHSLFPRVTAHSMDWSTAERIGIAVLVALLSGLIAWIVRMILARYTIFKNLQAFKILLGAVMIAFLAEALHFLVRYRGLH